MSSISLGLAGVSFEYNGRGERVRKVHEEFGVIKTTNYLFDEAGHLLVEQFVDGATTTTSEIIWMDGQPVGVIRNNVLRYIEPDHVHVFVDGRIVEQGGPELADELEANGYDRYLAQA